MKKIKTFIVFAAISIFCCFTNFQTFGQLINLITGKSHYNGFLSANFFSDNKRVITSSMYKPPKVYDITTKKLIHKFFIGNDYLWITKPVVMSSNEKNIYYVGRGDSVSVWNVENGKHLCNIPQNSLNFSPLFSNDGKMLLTFNFMDKNAYLWDCESGVLLEKLQHDAYTRKAIFSPDESILATSDDDGIIYLWEPKSGKLLSVIKNINVGIFDKIQFSPDGKSILYITYDNHVCILDVKTASMKFDKYIHHAEMASETVSDFSPDGKYFLIKTGDEDTISVYESETGKFNASFVVGKPMQSAIFTPDGKLILSRPVNALSLKLWNANTGTLVSELTGHKNIIISVRFNASGSKIVTASWDGTAKVWDATNGKLLFDLKGHKDELNSAEFSPDESKIVTASWDNTIKIWDVNTGKLLTTIKGRK